MGLQRDSLQYRKPQICTRVRRVDTRRRATRPARHKGPARERASESEREQGRQEAHQDSEMKSEPLP